MAFGGALHWQLHNRRGREPPPPRTKMKLSSFLWPSFCFVVCVTKKKAKAKAKIKVGVAMSEKEKEKEKEVQAICTKLMKGCCSVLDRNVKDLLLQNRKKGR